MFHEPYTYYMNMFITCKMAKKKKMYVQARTTNDDCGGCGIVMVAIQNKHDHKCMRNVTNVVGA